MEKGKFKNNTENPEEITVTYKRGEKLGEGIPEIEALIGYNFLGWAEGDNRTPPYKSDQLEQMKDNKVWENKVYKALYDPQLAALIYMQNHSTDDAGSLWSVQGPLWVGNKVKVTANIPDSWEDAAGNRYVFAGVWNTEPDGSGILHYRAGDEYEIVAVPNLDGTYSDNTNRLYAQWKRQMSYSVEYYTIDDNGKAVLIQDHPKNRVYTGS